MINNRFINGMKRVKEYNKYREDRKIIKGKRKEFEIGSYFVYGRNDEIKDVSVCKCKNCTKRLSEYSDSSFTDWHGDTTTTRTFVCPICNTLNKITIYS